MVEWGLTRGHIRGRMGTDGPRRAGQKAKKDPNAPKKAKSAWLLFCDAMRDKVRAIRDTLFAPPPYSLVDCVCGTSLGTPPDPRYCGGGGGALAMRDKVFAASRTATTGKV